MPIISLTFQYPSSQLNTSVQIGDLAWAVETPNINSSNFTGNDINQIQLIGPITNIDNSNTNFFIISVNNDATGFTPAPTHFIMFSKDNKANMTSILGYYAEVKLVNNSTERIELFAVGSEIVESSK